MDTLRSSVLKIASGLPVGDPVRRKLLRVAGRVDVSIAVGDAEWDLDFGRIRWKGQKRTPLPGGEMLITPEEGRIPVSGRLDFPEDADVPSERDLRADLKRDPPAIDLTDRQQDDLYGLIPIRGEIEGPDWMATVYASPGFAEFTKFDMSTNEWGEVTFELQGYVDAEVFIDIDN